MTKKELLQLIAKKEGEIEKLFDPSTFTLNPLVLKLRKEIEQLQAQCEHEYEENGRCKYCNKEKN